MLLVFIAMCNFAQNNTKDTIKLVLNEVVITGTKTERNPIEVPGRISVISSTIIAQSPAQQVDDILRYTPGINVSRTTGIYSQRPMVTLRGLSGDEQSRTLVLINGVPVNTSDEGGVNWNRINQFDIERIEVFKGPGSSLYGNNAMGGVINIITKKPTKPQEVYGGVSFGTYNTLRQDLSVRIRNDKGYYGSVSQYYLQSDGYNNVPDSKKTAYDIARSLDEISLSVITGNDTRKWLRWELQYDIFRDERGEGYRIYSPKGCYRHFNTNLFRGNINGGNDKTRYDLNVFYQMENYFDVNEKLSKGSYSRYDVNSYREDMGALFNINQELFSNNTLTAGLEYKTGSIEGGDYYQTPRTINNTTLKYDTVYNDGEISTAAGYLQDEHAFFNKKIRLIMGLRYDQVTFMNGDYYSTDPWKVIPELKNNTWTELSPRGGLRFNFIKEFSAYLSYSHGFRASILDDLTRTGWMWVGPKYANPELGPESLDNYEFGADIFPFEKLRISTSAYYSIGDDFLYYIATQDKLYGRSIYRRENVTNVTVQGAEGDIQYNLFKGLNLLASYSYTDSKINAFTERPELENKRLKYVPWHSASASLLWKNKYINTSFRSFYKGDQYSDDENKTKLKEYFTYDLQVSKQIKEHYIFSVDVQDLLDNRHMETADYLSPGRLVTGRIAVTF